MYGHLRCICTVYLAGKSPNVRTFTVYMYGVFSREITKYTDIYGVYIRFWPTLCILPRVGWPEPYIYTFFLAGKSPNVRTFTVYMYGSGRPCIYPNMSGSGSQPYAYTQDWSEPHFYTVSDRVSRVMLFLDIPYVHRIYL